MAALRFPLVLLALLPLALRLLFAFELLALPFELRLLFALALLLAPFELRLLVVREAWLLRAVELGLGCRLAVRRRPPPDALAARDRPA